MIEFKQRVVREVETGVLSLTGAARKYEVSATAISYWRKKVRGGGMVERPTKRKKALEKEVERLKIRLAEEVMDKEFLKKAQAYLQRLRSLDTCVITASNVDQFRGGAQ